MKFWTQTENGKHGNCLSACLASLLDLDLAIIPNFANYGENWYLPFDAFLHSQGFESDGMFYFNGFSTIPNLVRTWDDLLIQEKGFDGVFIVGGPSPRDSSISHAVLYKDNKLLHDPHPDRSGIQYIKYAYLITKL